MRHIARHLVIGGAALLVVAGTARAQAPAPSTVAYPGLGGSLGISVPVGELAKTHSAGFNLSAVTELRDPREAVGVRGELLYQYFAGKSGATAAASSVNTHGLGLLVNVLYRVPGYDFRPYVIGGMGLYALSGQGSHPGLNAGVGMDIPLPGVRAYVEARVHTALTPGPGYVTIPIAFGAVF